MSLHVVVDEGCRGGGGGGGEFGGPMVCFL